MNQTAIQSEIEKLESEMTDFLCNIGGSDCAAYQRMRARLNALQDELKKLIFV